MFENSHGSSISIETIHHGRWVEIGGHCAGNAKRSRRERHTAHECTGLSLLLVALSRVAQTDAHPYRTKPWQVGKKRILK
jgi:hypothetical protein